MGHKMHNGTGLNDEITGRKSGSLENLSLNTRRITFFEKEN